MKPRLYLSPPHMTGREQAAVAEAIASNWVAPVGPNIEAFEQAVAKETGCGHAVALSSGTAALHLALIVCGVGRGDEVWCSTLTFAASANPIRYLGAIPVFVDCDDSGNIDVVLVSNKLAGAICPPKALIAVDLYGQVARMDELEILCQVHGIALIEDAAEALGAIYKGRHAGTFGTCGIYSFNGNKIITTSGGGMLVSKDKALVDRARHLATQAREPAQHYEHKDIGYNYRMSNILAAIGIVQLSVLKKRVAQRKRVHEWYRKAHFRLFGERVMFLPEDRAGSESTNWLTVIRPSDRDHCIKALAEDNIESRPVWKPLHLQESFSGCRTLDDGMNSMFLFRKGLCLPSGSAMTKEDVERVVTIINKVR